jgi:hypothetical protein
MQEVTGTHEVSWTQVCLVLAALACCMGCLWMVFFFGRKIQTSAYVRDSLVNAAKGEELRNLLRDLEAKKMAGPLDPSKPPPPGFEREARRIWQSQPTASGPTTPSGQIFRQTRPQSNGRRCINSTLKKKWHGGLLSNSGLPTSGIG